MPISAIILTVAILIGVFTSDLGRRAITTRRLVRPLMIAAGVGSLYLTAFATSGAGLAVELAGAGTGILLGLLAGALMRVEHDSQTGETFSRAGIGYAVIWAAAAAGRLAFIYGAQHWFSGSLGSWMMTHHVTADALTNGLILVALAMATTRTLSLVVRSQMRTSGQPVGVAVAEPSI